MWLFTSCHQRIGLAKIGPGGPKLAAKTDPPSGFIVHYCLSIKWQAVKQTTGMDYTPPI